ncbi:MAG: 50S ribosomal protein L4 [Promicromonosporaceae bacterium]|nr:50S ribosomal protein L4 [Promicromonosporaceae bacterium]
MATQTIDVLGANGQKAGTTELPAEIFDAVTNVPLIHQVVVAQRAAARQGTAATKTRGMVSGGGRKPFKQKGTGRARQGSTRAPQYKGGGVVHGPQPRDYSQRTPKKMIAAALRGALSDRARHGRIHVVSDFGITGKPSTKAALAVLHRLAPATHGQNHKETTYLVVVDRNDEKTILSLRNAAEVWLLTPDQLNAYDVVTNDQVVFTSAALAEYLQTATSQVARLKHTPLTVTQIEELIK